MELLRWEISRSGGERAISGVHLDADANNPHLFETTLDLYVLDRCWVPRTVCSLKLESGRQLQLPAGSPTNAVLRAGGYFVVLGPAAAVGAGSLFSFSKLLEDQLGVPVVNLARGGAGPSVYLHASWPLIEPLLLQAGVIITVIMSGRSSANSAAGMGVSLHVREKASYKSSYVQNKYYRPSHLPRQ